LFALLLPLAQPVHAALHAQTPRSAATATGNWAAVAYAQGQTPTAAPYTILWTISQGKARDFFAIRNIGNFSLVGLAANVTQSQTSNNGKPPNTSFDWCKDGVWSVATNTCSGSIVFMGAASDATLIMNFNGLNLAVGSELSMRATTQPNLQNAYSSTISVLVARNQIRSGIVTNS
jgi:hypothetical protein